MRKIDSFVIKHSSKERTELIRESGQTEVSEPGDPETKGRIPDAF